MSDNIKTPEEMVIKTLGLTVHKVLEFYKLNYADIYLTLQKQQAEIERLKQQRRIKNDNHI